MRPARIMSPPPMPWRPPQPKPPPWRPRQPRPAPQRSSQRPECLIPNMVLLRLSIIRYIIRYTKFDVAQDISLEITQDVRRRPTGLRPARGFAGTEGGARRRG